MGGYQQYVETQRIRCNLEVINSSGGTRTRTGDTVIFSSNSYVLACPSSVAASPGHYQGIGRRSRKKPPVGPLSGRVAAQTGVSAPSSTERVAPDPPMSVRTQPGQTELTRIPLPRSSEARMRVSTFKPALERR